MTDLPENGQCSAKAAHSKGIQPWWPNPALQHTLKQSALGERDRSARPGHDDVIEHLDVNQRKRVAQGAGQQLVGPAWLRRSGRVVVRKDDGGGVVTQRL